MIVHQSDNTEVLSHPLDEARVSRTTLFNSTAWHEILKQSYDLTIHHIAHKRTVTSFPIAIIRNGGFEKISSLPFCDYIAPTVADRQSFEECMDDLKQFYPDASIRLKWVLPEVLFEDLERLGFSRSAIRHSVPVQSYENAWDAMDSRFRNKVRQARDNELVAKFSNDIDSLTDFYNAYHGLRVNKFKKIPQSFEFMKTVWATFIEPDRGFVLKVGKEDRWMAFAVCLIHKNTIYYKFGSSLPEYLSFKPNNLLFDSLFKKADELGIQRVDLGLSGIDESYKGLVRFKEKMGGIPQDISSYNYVPESFPNGKSEELKKLLSSITQTIVNSDPTPKLTSTVSKQLYPLFA